MKEQYSLLKYLSFMYLGLAIFYGLVVSFLFSTSNFEYFIETLIMGLLFHLIYEEKVEFIKGLEILCFAFLAMLVLHGVLAIGGSSGVNLFRTFSLSFGFLGLSITSKDSMRAEAVEAMIKRASNKINESFRK